MLVSSFGHILTKRWNAGADVLASTAWQLTAGGLFLLPVAAVVEGPPPTLSPSALLAFAYVALIATALAFAAWFTGLRRLPAGTVGLIGLLNPVTGVLLGTAVAGEPLTGRQLGGLLLVLVGVALGRPRRAGRVPLPTTLRRTKIRCLHRVGPVRTSDTGEAVACPSATEGETTVR